MDAKNHDRDRTCYCDCRRAGIFEDQKQTQVNSLGGVLCRPIHRPGRKEMFTDETRTI